MSRPALSSTDIEAMRARLSDAAFAIYERDGLDAVSFRRLAEVVGSSHTLPYRYFEDKDALLARVRTECFRRFEGFVRSRENSSGPMTEHIRSVAHAYVDFVRLHPGEYRLMFSTEQPPPDRHPELLAARRSLFDHVVGVLQGYVDAGVLEGDVLLLTHALWIGLHGVMTLHVANQLVHGRTLEDLVEPLLDRILAARSDAAAVPPKRRRSTRRPAKVEAP